MTQVVDIPTALNDDLDLFKDKVRQARYELTWKMDASEADYIEQIKIFCRIRLQRNRIYFMGVLSYMLDLEPKSIHHIMRMCEFTDNDLIAVMAWQMLDEELKFNISLEG